MRRVLLCLAILAAVAVPSAAAPARPQDCTEANATALFQTFPVAFQVVRPRTDAPQIVESIGRCQYRIFSDGATFTFSENDVILAGIVEFWDYAAQGMSRAEGIALIESVEDRLQIDGVEQTLQRTAYKDVIHPVFGRVVYQHRAAMLRLSPGVHTSEWQNVDPIFGTSTATVTLVITPSP
jgi:hypothetical protein